MTKTIKQPKPGSKEAALRARREAGAGSKRKPAVRGRNPDAALSAAVAGAIGHPPVNAPKPKTKAKAAGKPKGARKKQMPRKPAVKPKATPAPAAGPASPDSGVREGSKVAEVGKLLLRPEGCLTEDVLSATGWPSVSMPQQAKALSLVLRTEKEGRKTRYFGSVAAV